MKKLLLVGALVLSTLTMSACGQGADDGDRFTNTVRTYITVDSETGCKYLSRQGGGITPLLKSDGKVDCPDVK